jgi:hypothetical protein
MAPLSYFTIEILILLVTLGYKYLWELYLTNQHDHNGKGGGDGNYFLKKNQQSKTLYHSSLRSRIQGSRFKMNNSGSTTLILSLLFTFHTQYAKSKTMLVLQVDYGDGNETSEEASHALDILAVCLQSS